MAKFKVKIYDVGISEHEIHGLEDAIAFIKNSVGHKGEIISEEGLVIRSVVPEKGPTIVPPPAPEPVAPPPPAPEPVVSAPVSTPIIESVQKVEEPIAKIEEPVKKVEELVAKIEEPVKNVEESVSEVEESAPVINVFVNPDAIDVDKGEEAPIINVIVDSAPEIKSILEGGINKAEGNVKVTSFSTTTRKKYKK